MNLFAPEHARLISACYPPSSALLSAAPEYSPNSQELSRLTYYASNHTGKISKLGAELEKKVKVDVRKARAGNMRHRASLLITLAILKALAAECRRDLTLLSPSLVSSLQEVSTSLSTDLEVIAKLASVLTAWTTYTDGRLVGTDSSLTRDYLSTLQVFVGLSRAESKNNDDDTRNRTRLIGFAALTSALNSEALYSDQLQYKEQVAIIVPSIISTLLQVKTTVLDEQAALVKDSATSPYLAEFRSRPAIERRAASIHLHIDGDKGPTMADVSNACLHALHTLLEHANGSQLDFIMQSSLDCMEELDGWRKPEACCWFARKACEWSMYQYRYAVPTRLVERLLQTQDIPETKPIHTALSAMVTTVFNAPTPLINLSTSDIVSNLITITLRRTTIDPQVELLSSLVECISSLGRHIYYADQVIDLSAELISRLTVIEAQGVPGPDKSDDRNRRAQAIRCLLAGLVGLMEAADGSGLRKEPASPSPASAEGQTPAILSVDTDSSKKHGRARVPPDVWHDTLNLLCDEDSTVRAHFIAAVKFYLTNEASHASHAPGGSDGPRSPDLQQAHRDSKHLDQSSTKFLNTVHGYLYMLATASSTTLPEVLPDTSPSPISITIEVQDSGGPELHVVPPTPSDANGSPPEAISPPGSTRHSLGANSPQRLTHPLLQRLPSRVYPSGSATVHDYARMADVLCTAHEHLPIYGLLTGIPMLMTLDAAIRSTSEHSQNTDVRIFAIRQVMAHVWLSIGRVWGIAELVELAEKAVSSIPESHKLPSISDARLGVLPLSQEEPTLDVSSITWAGLSSESALLSLVSSAKVQDATGLGDDALLRKFKTKWTAQSALRDFNDTSASDSAREDGVSPLLKISPALMHIENLSLQSLARSARSVGVSELRQALEGRNSMSNPALSKAPSISTLESPTGLDRGMSKLTPTRSRSRAKKRTVTTGAGEVRDVLNRLGIGKPQNGTSGLKRSVSNQAGQ